MRKLIWLTLPALLWIACDDDPGAPSDAEVVDASLLDQSTLDADADADVGEAVEPSFECCAPPPPPITFPQQAATAFCKQLQACCGDGGFDASVCAAGWESSNRDLLLPGVIDGGRIVLDQTAATSCLAGTATLSCTNIGSPEMKTITANCFAAVSGKQGVGSPCRADSECQTAEYCTTSGTCALLLVQDAGCTRIGECAYKGGPSPPLFCNGTCQPRLPNDAGCASDDECASGICDPTSQACANALASACSL